MCSSKSIQVVPLKVVEEIIKTNLSGKETTYTVQFPDNNGTKVNITKLKGEIFSSADKVKQFMIKNSVDAIEKMVTAAVILNEQVFGIIEDETIKDSSLLPQLETVMPDMAMVDLGDGQKAKINLGELKKINVG